MLFFISDPEKSQHPGRHHSIALKLHLPTVKSSACGREIFELPSPGGAGGWTPLHPESSVHELLERQNRELKRRTRVATLFPDDSSLLRPVTAILAEISDEWETGPMSYLMFKNQQ